MMNRVRLVGRREFLRRLGAGGALLWLGSAVACGDPRQADRLSFLNWLDYIDPELLDQFTTRTGFTVTYETYASNDELAQRLAQAQRSREGGRSGTSFDLIVPSDNFVTRFRNGDALAELDLGAIPNVTNLEGVFRSAEFDPGNRFSVPWATGTTGIGYDRTVFSEPPGYEVFLDQTYSGRLSVLAEIRDAFGLALFSLGLDPNSSSRADIDAAADRLIEMKQVISGFDSSGYLEGLASGELVAAQAYSSDLAQAREINPNLDYVLPPPGALRWIDNLTVPIDAPRPANAFQFINFYLEPEVAAANSAFIKANTGNEAARAFLPESFLEDSVIFAPDELSPNLVFTVDLGDAEDLYAEAWEQVQNA